jgi:hypothetical protein
MLISQIDLGLPCQQSLCGLIQELLREKKLLGEERVASPEFRQTLQKKTQIVAEHTERLKKTTR